MKQNPPEFSNLEAETEGGGGRTGLEVGDMDKIVLVFNTVYWLERVEI